MGHSKVEPIAKRPPHEGLLSFILEKDGEAFDIEIAARSEPLDIKRHPDWRGAEIQPGRWLYMRIIN